MNYFSTLVPSGGVYVGFSSSHSSKVERMMQSYPATALDRRLQVDWARDPREDSRVLMSLRVDFEPMG